MIDDETQEALLTPRGMERELEKHDEKLGAGEKRFNGLEARVTDIEQKEARRDKRWDLAVRSLLAIGTGIIIAVATLLIGGGHP
jgi:hypothetical protein